jgi:hypothetical protein
VRAHQHPFDLGRIEHTILVWQRGHDPDAEPIASPAKRRDHVIAADRQPRPRRHIVAADEVRDLQYRHPSTVNPVSHRSRRTPRPRAPEVLDRP